MTINLIASKQAWRGKTSWKHYAPWTGVGTEASLENLGEGVICEHVQHSLNQNYMKGITELGKGPKGSKTEVLKMIFFLSCICATDFKKLNYHPDYCYITHSFVAHIDHML